MKKNKLLRSVFAVLLAVVLCIPSVIMPETEAHADSGVGAGGFSTGSSALDWQFQNTIQYLVFCKTGDPDKGEMYTADIFARGNLNDSGEFTEVINGTEVNVLSYRRRINLSDSRNRYYDITDYSRNSYSLTDGTIATSHSPRVGGGWRSDRNIMVKYSIDGSASYLPLYKDTSESQRKSGKTSAQSLLEYYDEPFMRSDIDWYNEVYSYLQDASQDGHKENAFIITQMDDDNIKYVSGYNLYKNVPSSSLAYGVSAPSENTGLYANVTGGYHTVSYANFEKAARTALRDYKNELTRIKDSNGNYYDTSLLDSKLNSVKFKDGNEAGNAEFFNVLRYLNSGTLPVMQDGKEIEIALPNDVQKKGKQALRALFTGFGMEFTPTISDIIDSEDGRVWFVVVPLTAMCKMNKDSTNYSSRVVNLNGSYIQSLSTIPAETICYLPGMLLSTKNIWNVATANAFYGGRLTGAIGTAGDRGARGYQADASGDLGNASSFLLNPLKAISQKTLSAPSVLETSKVAERPASFEPALLGSARGSWSSWSAAYPEYDDTKGHNKYDKSHYTYSWWQKHTGTILQKTKDSKYKKNEIPALGQGYAAFGPISSTSEPDNYYTSYYTSYAFQYIYNPYAEDYNDVLKKDFVVTSIGIRDNDEQDIVYAGKESDIELGGLENRPLRQHVRAGETGVDFDYFKALEADGYRTIITYGTVSEPRINDTTSFRKFKPTENSIYGSLWAFRQAALDESNFPQISVSVRDDIDFNSYVGYAGKFDLRTQETSKMYGETHYDNLSDIDGSWAYTNLALDYEQISELFTNKNSFIGAGMDAAQVLLSSYLAYTDETTINVPTDFGEFAMWADAYQQGISADPKRDTPGYIELGKNSFKFKSLDGEDNSFKLMDGRYVTPVKFYLSVKVPEVKSTAYRVTLTVDGDGDKEVIRKLGEEDEPRLKKQKTYKYLFDDIHEYELQDDDTKVEFYVYVPNSFAIDKDTLLNNLSGKDWKTSSAESVQSIANRLKTCFASASADSEVDQIVVTDKAMPFSSSTIGFDVGNRITADGYTIYEVVVNKVANLGGANSILYSNELSGVGSTDLVIDGVTYHKGAVTVVFPSSSADRSLKYSIVKGGSLLGDASKTYDTHVSRSIGNINYEATRWGYGTIRSYGSSYNGYGSIQNGGVFKSTTPNSVMDLVSTDYYYGYTYDFYFTSYLNRAYFAGKKTMSGESNSIPTPVISSMTAYDTANRAALYGSIADYAKWSGKGTYNSTAIMDISSVANSYGYGYGYTPNTQGVAGKSGVTLRTKYKAQYDLTATLKYGVNTIVDPSISETFTVETYIPKDMGTGKLSDKKISDNIHVVSGEIDWTYYPEVEMNFISKRADNVGRYTSSYDDYSNVNADGSSDYSSALGYYHSSRDDWTEDWSYAWYDSEEGKYKGITTRNYTDSEKLSRAQGRYNAVKANGKGQVSYQSGSSAGYRSSVYWNTLYTIGLKARHTTSSYYVVGKYNKFFEELAPRKGILMCDTMVTKSGSIRPQIYAGSDISLSVAPPSTIPFVENTNATFYCLSMLDSGDKVHGTNMWGVKSQETAVNDDAYDDSYDGYNKLTDYYRYHTVSYWNASDVIGDANIPTYWNGGSPKAKTEEELKKLATTMDDEDGDFVVKTAEVVLTLTYDGGTQKQISFPVDMNRGADTEPIVTIEESDPGHVWQLTNGDTTAQLSVTAASEFAAKAEDLVDWSELSLSSWGVKSSIMNSIETSSNTNSISNWYSEIVRTMCIRKYKVVAKTPIDTGAIMVEDKIPYDYMPAQGKKATGTWVFNGYNVDGDLVVTFKITNADFDLIYGTNEDL